MRKILVLVLTCCLLGCHPSLADKFGSVFGQKLGTTFEPNSSVASHTNMLGIFCQFVPNPSHNYFERYFVVLTPITHKIYQITAEGPFEAESVNQIRMESIAKTIRDKYGLKMEPLEDLPNSKQMKSTDGQYAASVAYDNKVGKSRLQLIYLSPPLLNLSIEESASIRQKSINDAARNNSGL